MMYMLLLEVEAAERDCKGLLPVVHFLMNSFD
jgi:hypothetical protein